MNRKELDRMTVAELRKKAVSLGLPGVSRLRKSQLVDLLAGSKAAKKPSAKTATPRSSKKPSTKTATPKSSKKPSTKTATPKAAKKSAPTKAPAKKGVAGKSPATKAPAKKGVASKSPVKKKDGGADPGRRARRQPGPAAPVEDGVSSVSSVSPRLKRAFISRPKNGEQRARASKYYLGVPESPDLDQGFDYPETYGENIISLMVRDPYWLFSYWEFAPELRGELVARIGEDALLRSRTVLRVYDVTGTDPEHALGHYDIDVAPEARNWYINVARVEREYCVDVGLIAPDGTFIVIARSNRVSLPPVGPSDSVDEEWVTIEALDELYVRIDARRGPTSGSGGWGSGGFGS